MIKLLLLSIVLTSSNGALDQASPRAERKKPLSEAVEKALADFVQSCVPAKQKQLTGQMEELVGTIGSTVRITPEETLALQQAAKQAVDTAMHSWQPQFQVMLRTHLSRTSAVAATRLIGMWDPETAGPHEPMEDWTPPDDDASWLAAVKTTLGAERHASWHEADLKARRQAETQAAESLEGWVLAAHARMNQDLTARIGRMKKSLDLSEEQTTALNKAAETLLDSLCTAEKKRAVSMLLTLPPSTREYVVKQSRSLLSFDRPAAETWDRLWTQAASGVLSAEMISRWQKIEKEDLLRQETELADMIKPSEQQAERMMQAALDDEIDGMVMTLNLAAERRQALEKLSKEAVQTSLKQARKGWLQQAKNYPASERSRMHGHLYFGVSDELQAIRLPVWTGGLKKLLSDAERTRLENDSRQRVQRACLALARACLAEMDKMLALSRKQRALLEPPMVEVMLPFLALHKQQHWSYNVSQLCTTAGKIKEDLLRSTLDDVQLRRWHELVTSDGRPPRRTMPDANTSFPEVTDMEAAVSQHLYKLFVAERSKMLAVMMPHVEEAARLLSLPQPAVARLTTAAKGAVEASLEHWRQYAESLVRQSVQNATPDNLMQTLAGTEHAHFSHGGAAPQLMEIWETALQTTLDESQRQKLRQAEEERGLYQLKAMAAMSTSELDRRRRLSADQFARVESAIQQVLADYRPDIERYMSFQWFLQYYYALVPLAGVPEKDLQAILTPEQWRLCKDHDLPDARQYWEGIQNNHEQRLKQGAQAGGGRIIFNGVMFDQ